MMAVVGCSAGTPTTPTGWTALGAALVTTGGALALTVLAFYKTAVAGDTGGSTVVTPGGTLTTPTMSLVAYSGVSGATPFTAHHYSASGSPGTAYSVSPTTTVDNQMMVNIETALADNNTVVSVGVCTGMTSRSLSPASSALIGIRGQEEFFASSGSFVSGTGTTSTSSDRVESSFALNPAPPVVPFPPEAHRTSLSPQFRSHAIRRGHEFKPGFMPGAILSSGFFIPTSQIRPKLPLSAIKRGREFKPGFLVGFAPPSPPSVAFIQKGTTLAGQFPWPLLRRGHEFKPGVTQAPNPAGMVILLNPEPSSALSSLFYVIIQAMPRGVYQNGTTFPAETEVVIPNRSGTWFAYVLPVSSFSDPNQFYQITERFGDGRTRTYKARIPAGTPASSTVLLKDVLI